MFLFYKCKQNQQLTDQLHTNKQTLTYTQTNTPEMIYDSAIKKGQNI